MGDEVKPVSKNQQKRLLKIQKQKESRVEWRKKMRERRKQQRVLKALDPQETPVPSHPKPVKDPLPKRFHLLIDAGFDDLMTEREVTSLAAQMVRCYAANRRAQQPVFYTVSSFGGHLEGRFRESHPDYHKFDINWLTAPYEETFPKDQLVYLSADAEETLDELDETKIYIIGGLVDRNRHKNITMEKALAQGIKVAKLPLAEHVRLKSCQALTCNHVFELLLARVNGKSWQECFAQVIPKRKINE